MYCSSCGRTVMQGLSYCNHCGVKLNGSKRDDKDLFPESLVWAIVTVFIVGFGCIIGMTAMMKKLLDASPEMISIVILLGFLLMIAVEGVFIWLLLRQKIGAKQANDSEQPEAQMMKELSEATGRVLTEPARSVTEHTTRNFEPVYIEQKSE